MNKTLTAAPAAVRTHIAFLGRMNSGKSALLNALAGQTVAIVDGAAGTTTDPVRKSMEIHGIGPCVLVDTAGFDDSGILGEKRVYQTEKAAKESDIAVILFSQIDMSEEVKWYRRLQEQGTAVLAVVSRVDERADTDALCARIQQELRTDPIRTSARTGEGVDSLRRALIDQTRQEESRRSITGSLCAKGDTVLLVMPQDPQAPEGRLILPQVQTIRELLDKKCLVVSCVTEGFEDALAALREPPKLIITDSQVYKTICDRKPKESVLTSFSTLFAAWKGDMRYFLEGARAIERLRETDRVLIAEACTHAPMEEDIGRVKLPRLLRKKVGEGLQVDIVAGRDFPDNLSDYALILQCGACMFNRTYVMSRVREAKEQGVPMTNYGVAIAYLNGILDEVAVNA